MQARSRTLNIVVAAILATALPPCVIGATATDDWPVVDDAALAGLRGGVDIGPLIANFAIERVVRIDGEIIARTLLVVDFSKVGSGGLPTLQVIGDLANLIQVGPGNTAAGVDASALANAAAAAASEAAHAAVAEATASVPLPPAPGSSASTVSATSGITTGSEAQFGAALTHAVDVVTGGGPPAASASVATAAPLTAPASVVAAADTLASAAPVAPVAPVASVSPLLPVSPAGPTSSASPAAPASPMVPASPAIPAAPVAAGDVAAVASVVRVVGNTGQVVVVSNLPDAAALATAIQNSAAQTRLETQTTINATLNSLAMLQSGALADAIRQQVAQSLGGP